MFRAILATLLIPLLASCQTDQIGSEPSTQMVGSDTVICVGAISTFQHLRWSTSTEFVLEAKRRGLTVQQCAALTGRSTQVSTPRPTQPASPPQPPSSAAAKEELAEVERKPQEKQAKLSADAERKHQSEQVRLAAELQRRHEMAQLSRQQEEVARRIEEERRRQELARLAAEEKRVALVIGNGEYRHSATLPSLRNPSNDARDIAATLSKLGFDIIGGGVQLDLDKIGMENAIIEFGERLGEGSVGLFYYAGHGLAVNKTNFLIPVDTDKMTKKTVNMKLVSADLVMDQFPRSGGLNIMILDACRNTPASLRGVRGNENEGLVQMRAPSGTLISYATQPGNVALDGTGRNSPYAAALIEKMQQPGVGILEVFNDVGVEVEKNTDGFQRPWINSSPLEGKFYFNPLALAKPPPVQPSPDSLSELIFWQSIQNSNDPSFFEAYLSQYPNGAYAALARNRLNRIKQQ